MKNPFRSVVVLSAAASLCLAGETKIWSQVDRSDFEKGTLKQLSLVSDGTLMLAPALRELLDSASVYLWALAEDSKGNVYAGGGGPGGPGAQVYAIGPDGKGRSLAQLEELEVQALAIDKKDQVYAATSPDGKVYRISPAGSVEVFFDPRAKYIWAMAFNSKGDLFVATGDRGDIYRVTPSGTGDVFYRTAETHARSLAVDAADNLIIGTEPGGLILRVAPGGDGFVLYQAGKREITAVAVAKDGSIYAAGVGNKQPAGAPPALTPPPVVPGAPQPAPVAPGGQQPQQQQQQAVRPAPAAPQVAAPTLTGGSEVYRIDKEGFPRKVWTHAQAIAYAIGFDPAGRPLIGTGNRGTIYRLDSDLVYTELLNAAPTQVTRIQAGREGRLYAATGNVGKVYQIGPELEKEGNIESEVLDAGLFSYWGRLSFRGQASGGAIAIETRSGNLDRPQKDWSPWSAVAGDGGRVASPPARFLQWRVTMKASGAEDSPRVESVDVAYLPKNVPPQVQQIEATPANYRFPQQQALVAASPPTLTLPPLGRPPARRTPQQIGADGGSASMQYAKGWVGARWLASDENGDTLVYTVHIRGERETEWKLLRDSLKERQISWDSTAFPDGEYRLRVIASDAPDNPAGQALTAELVGPPFLIDNTPPEISGLEASAAGGKLTVRWKAADALSIIERAEYSLNGGDWMFVEPVARLSDSREQEYVLTLERPSPGEQTIAVRVSDEYANQSVAKTVIR